MNTDPKKWNPFKFLRGSARKQQADSAPDTPASGQWRAAWPDISRLFRAIRGVRSRSFSMIRSAGRGALERWFGDFSSSRFPPRIDVPSTKARSCA